MYFNTLYNKSKNISDLFVKSNNISYTSQNNITIEFLEVTYKNSPVVSFTNCNNITIRFLKVKDVIRDTGTTTYDGKNVGVFFKNCNNVNIGQLYIENTTGGIYAFQGSNFTIDNLFVQRIYRDPNWGLTGNSGRGQAVQFNTVDGINIIKNFKIQNPFGYKNEDFINIYNAPATSSTLIEKGEIRGAGGNMSPSGGGVLVGDGPNTSTASDNCTIQDLKIVTPGQYGAAIAGGNNHLMQRLEIYSPSIEQSNVGAYCARFASILFLTNCTVKDNKVNWKYGPDRSNPPAAGAQNNYYLPTSGAVACIGLTTSNNVQDLSLNDNLLPQIIVSEELFEEYVYQFL